MIGPRLQGERVVLRPLAPSDAPRIVALLSDPDVTRTLRAVPPASIAAEELFIEAMAQAPADLAWGVTARDDGRLLGIAGLHHLDDPARQAELGIFVGPRAEWGRGFGGEATRLVVRHGFEGRGLHRIWLQVHADHAPAIALYERAGFRREGLLRQSARRGEAFVDVVVMGLLREEWAAAARAR